MLNTGPDGDIDVRCNGVSMMTGKMGRLGRHVAVRIDAVKMRGRKAS